MKSIIKIIPGKSISRIDCSLPDEIVGIAYSQKEKTVVFYCCDGSVGFAGDNGIVRRISRRLEVPSPVGMCCDKWGIVILQLSREMLWSFDQSLMSGMRLCGGGVFESFSRTLAKSPSTSYGMCRTSRNSLGIAVPGANQIIWVHDGSPGEVWGTGGKGFRTGTSSKTIMFDSPVGICLEGDSLLVSDKGNAIIRVFKRGVETAFVGMPGDAGFRDGTGTSSRLKAPATIRSSRGMAAFVDGNLVRTLGVASLVVSTPYASSNEVLDIAIGSDAIYVLEEK